MRIDGSIALVTGGASGIGLALARVLAARGARLVVTGRDQGKLDALAVELGKERIAVLAGDVRDGAHRRAALALAVERFGGLSILVNNAGVVRAGRLETFLDDEVQAILDVNLVAPVLWTRDALPLLRARAPSKVVGIASGIALIGTPFYGVYAASKAGLARFDEALRRELSGEGVSVLTVYPTATETPMMSTSRAGPAQGLFRETAESVAEGIAEAIVRDALEEIRGGEARLAMVETNQRDPSAVDARFAGLKAGLEEAVADHRAM